LITDVVQRWRDRRGVYRPKGETIRTSDYDVAELAGPGSDNVAKAFIERQHYSGTYPAARRRFGLFRRHALVGVAVFSQPIRSETLACVGCPVDEAIELGRFALLDDVPDNGESWFLARAREVLAHDFAGFVSFSDPMPRSAVDGARVFPGHIGTIYQASNAAYLGRCRPDKLGERSVVQDVAARLALVCSAPALVDSDPTAWLDRHILPKNRTVRRLVNKRAQPYPKFLSSQLTLAERSR
jgi:hypothetical protein